MTEADHRAAGRKIRKSVPRSRHAEWEPPSKRPDPVAVLRGSEYGRLPDLLALRYSRMAASPFAFLRGSGMIMAADLASAPDSGLMVQACGDAHIGNFGLLGTPERALNLDLNDFDETLPGPFEWDLKRLAASAVVAARSNGFSRRDSRRIATAAARSYRTHIAQYASQGALDVWYSSIDLRTLDDVLRRAKVSATQYRIAKKRAQRARDKDHLRALRRLTTTVDGELRLRDDPPILFHDARDAEVLDGLVHAYRDSLPDHLQVLLDRYELVDFAIRVVGVSSVATRCWVALFAGHSGNAGHSLILQVKQAGRSVLAPYVAESHYPNEGQRVVEGQRLMQAAGDILLGWTRGGNDGVDYYVRQLWDWKGSVDTEVMNVDSLRLFAQLCGWTLARAHARSGDAAAISGYIGSGNAFDGAISDFAVAYADQTDDDHRVLCQAIERGELPTDGQT